MISHGRRKAMATDLFEILHEDADLLVINKPSYGWPDQMW